MSKKSGRRRVVVFNHQKGKLSRFSSLAVAQDYETLLTEAKAAFRRNPADAAVAKALAAAHLGLGNDAEARGLYEPLLKRVPQDWDMWLNLGAAENRLGNLEASIAAYERGLSINASSAESCAELAMLYRVANDHGKALKWFFAALEADPENTTYFVEWVSTLNRLRLFELGLQSLRAAWEDEPENPALATLMARIAQGANDWSLHEQAESFLQRERAAGRVHNAPHLYLVGLEGGDWRSEGALAAACFGDIDMEASKPRFPLCKNGLAPAVERRHERLRIGYLSADMHMHATAILIAGVLEQHAAAGLDMYVYSYGPSIENEEYRQRIRKAAVAFHDVRCRTDAQVINMIEQDEIDILVDLKGWTEDIRIAIQGLRPAPIVVTWLGFPGTLGHPLLADYVIGDPVVTPLEHADGYSETLALMPHCYQPNDDQRICGPRLTRSEVGLPDEAFVFCSFNRGEKINRRMFKIWCEVLRAVPGSVLWQLFDSDYAVARLREAAQENGVDPARLIFAPRMPIEQHLGRLPCADLALDSFPYTSHTTGSDALWAGVPLLALQGQTFASRVSSSLVTAAGLPDMVVHSHAEFRDMAIALATNPARLAEVRQRLNEGRTSCPLFDTGRFARNLARLYQAMWDNYQAGVKAPIVLSEA